MSPGFPAGDRVLRFRPPDLEDVRGDDCLLVFGDLPLWLVVDRELRAFLEGFDGSRTVSQAIAARRDPTGAGDSLRTLRRLVEDLERKRVLVGDSPEARPAPDRTGIASVTVNLTNECNLRCPFCCNARRSTSEIPVGRLARGIEEGKEALDRRASLFVLGGEPFLRPDRLLDLLDRTRDLFPGPALVSTNGTRVAGRLVRELARRRVVVQVSLDSAREDRHDAVRGRGVHARAVKAARDLTRGGVPTVLSMVYTRDRLDEFEPYLDLARELGVSEARFIPLRAVGGGSGFARLLPDQAAAFRALSAVLERRPELRPLLGRDFFSISAAMCRSSAGRRSCGVGDRAIFVDADGQVYPCPNHVAPPYACGSLAERSLSQIVRDSPVLAAIRRRAGVERLDRCADCAWRRWCAGDCRGEATALTGDPFAPSPHCGELKVMYREIVWAIARGVPVP